MNNKKNNCLSYLIALLYASAVGPITTKRLIENYPNLEELFSFSSKDLAAMGLTPAAIECIKNPPWDKVEKNLLWAEKDSNYIITILDENYPPLLKEIAAPPTILFASGNISKLASAQLAIVGSRNPSPSGSETAYLFATELAQAGLTITSGLAIGIDSKSHQGAIDAKKITIAVLGTGIDIIYPRSNLNLAKNIIANEGLLLSEFPIGTPPEAKNFPQRNRIISGLSLGTLVVEATLRSGSLITARYASEQGREVFAIPGSIHNPGARGCHLLIRQGAKLVETVSDILEELNIAKTTPLLTAKCTKTKNNLDLKQQKLLECMDFEITPVDILIARSGFTAQEVAATLMSLELLNLVNAVAGGYSKR